MEFLGWLGALALLLVTLEGACALFLHGIWPQRARKIRTRHALLGNRSWNAEKGAMPNEREDHRGYRRRRDPIPFFPLLGWRYHSPSVFWGLDTDKDGFIPNRRGERSAIDPEAAIRIWLVGGSTIAGSLLAIEEKACPDTDAQ